MPFFRYAGATSSRHGKLPRRMVSVYEYHKRKSETLRGACRMCVRTGCINAAFPRKNKKRGVKRPVHFS